MAPPAAAPPGNGSLGALVLGFLNLRERCRVRLCSCSLERVDTRQTSRESSLLPSSKPGARLGTPSHLVSGFRRRRWQTSRMSSTSQHLARIFQGQTRKQLLGPIYFTLARSLGISF
jgi:hypothetical protein